jgi:2-aminoadipate transaminase
MKIPGETDSAAMLVEALKRKIAYVPGDAFFFDHSGRDTLRLNFSVTPPEKIAEGISRLAELIIERQRTRTGV